jgi:transposase
VDEAQDVRAGVRPQLIVQVQTTVANVPDVEMTATIQAQLVKTELKPEKQIVDTGYVDADLLVSSHQQGIKLLGPVLSDNRGPRQSGQGL